MHGASERVQDEVLGSLLFTAGGVDSRSQPKSRSLLEAVDLENVLAADHAPLNVKDVPGGTISFLFERSSNSSIEDDEDASGEEL